MRITEVDEPKEDDKSSDRCVPNEDDEVSGWEVVRARMLHSTVPLLQLFNKMEGAAIALASQVYEFDDADTFVPLIQHISNEEKAEMSRAEANL